MDQQSVLLAVSSGQARFDWVPLGNNVEIMARPVRVGDRYVAVSARTAQLCADALSDATYEASLTTTTLEDAIWHSAGPELRPEPHLISPAHLNISSEAALLEASEALAGKLAAVPDNALVSYGKSWVLDPGLATHHGRAANYGMPSTKAPYRSVDGDYRLWQPLGFMHDWQHFDYSQLLRLARRRRGSPLPGYNGSSTRLNVTEVHPTGTVRTLHKGLTGEDVARWQTFLAGQGLLEEGVSGAFDEATRLATMEFQRRNGLDDDGWVGNKTLGKAMELGFAVTEPGAVVPGLGEDGPGWPAPPSDLHPLGESGRIRELGKIDWKPASVPGNPEAILILGTWVEDHIVKVELPWLARIPGVHQGGKVLQVHSKVAGSIVKLWQAWDDAGLLNRVLSFAGLWAPRLIRGSRTVLSSHAWGSAFDINAQWNALGTQPALKAKKGSVRELVAIANAHGWFWGGHFPGRPDGMHFEWARPE